MSLTSTSLTIWTMPDFGIHLDLRRGAHQLPERGPSAERMRGIVRIALLADADDLSARRAEMRLQELLVAQLAAGYDDAPIAHPHF